MHVVGSGHAAAEEQREAWQAHEAAVGRLTERFHGLYRSHSFDYVQPVRLQPSVPARLRRPYTVPVAYTEWGRANAPLVVCAGGVANTAMRFCFLAADLAQDFRVVCMDWVGRGRSGWLADDTEYAPATYVEQLRQMLVHLGAAGRGPGRERPAVTVLGSSMGGSTAIELAARHPGLIDRLVLVDVGPSIPRARRQRRGQTIARFYVFHAPHDLARRLGAAQKNDGPVRDEIRQFVAHHQTRWSAEHGGRIYSHDVRALMAYRRESNQAVDQWASWARVRCPTLLLHGMESDALTLRTIARMRAGHPLTVAHIPETGHTPVLSDRHQTGMILRWLKGDEDVQDGGDFSVLHAPRRAPWPAVAACSADR